VSAQEILSPPLPYRMDARIRRAAADVQLQQFVRKATSMRDRDRRAAATEAFGDRYDEARRLAGRIKRHTLDHLDYYLEQFEAAATRAGAQVHFALTADDANRICLDIARRTGAPPGARLCVKSKSMVTEETHLVPALEAAGVKTVETDLGEFIVQLEGDAPAHIVTPMIHKDRRSVARAFVRDLGSEYTEEPERLTRIAREHMRRLFREAGAGGIGVSGANFLIASTGTLVICTNEGNADLTTTLPPVHIAFVGIEKLIPAPAHLPIFLKLLARSATAQPITVYTTCITGPRREGPGRGERDGPRELHIILLDNGRSEILGGGGRELLACIRCGACLNTCPVYRAVGGGHAYGAVYSGPIGAALTPHLLGPLNYPDLPHASSLCGACRAACPVDIDIPGQLIALRRKLVERRAVGGGERFLMRAWVACLKHPRLYRAASRVLGAALGAFGGIANRGEPLRPRAWLSSAPGPLSGWTESRDLPVPARVRFRDWWRSREHGDGGAA
jgi:L-lactate dehydrogenase complex protein LldF